MSNYFIVERNAGAPQRLSKAAALRLARGDVVHIHTGSGGGFGDPLERDPESVARDVRETFAPADRGARYLRRGLDRSRRGRGGRDARLRSELPQRR